ncbi:hypothetical protein ACFQ1S_32270, partial [Kibdelosporangium lantanae]
PTYNTYPATNTARQHREGRNGSREQGIRLLAKVDYSNSGNVMVVAVSLGVGLVPTAVPNIYAEFPTWFRTVMESGISAGCLCAVLLNLLFNHVRAGRR